MTCLPRTTLLPSLIGLLILSSGVSLAQDQSSDPCERGQLYFQDDNYLAAEPFLRQCLEAGESLDALLPLTVISVLQDRADDGIAFGSRALALAPDNARVRYWYGRALLVGGDVESAVTQWEEGLRLDTTHGGILEGLARLSLRQGDDARAYNLLLQLRISGSDEAWLHEMLSTLARRRALWDRAADHWQDLVNVVGEDEEKLVVLGELNILAGRHDQALQIFRHAVATLPSGATYGGLGEAFFAMNEVDSATVALRKAVDMAPENAHNRFNLANCLQIQGDISGAEEQYVTYLEARPDDPTGHFKYGVHLELRDRSDEALTHIERAVALDTRYVEALVVLTQMYENRGMVDEALSAIDRLQELDPRAQAELDEWRRRLQDDQSTVQASLAAGKVELMHIIAGAEAADAVEAGLTRGDDFGSLATRFSSGPTAARGGIIGWVDPDDMIPALRDAIGQLAPGQTSGRVEAGGAVHFFKRIR